MNYEFDGPATLDKVFPLKFCINLDRRPARWTAMQENFARLGIESVAFDRSGYQFHGRIKALAEAAREAGLKF